MFTPHVLSRTEEYYIKCQETEKTSPFTQRHFDFNLYFRENLESWGQTSDRKMYKCKTLSTWKLFFLSNLMSHLYEYLCKHGIIFFKLFSKA